MSVKGLKKTVYSPASNARRSGLLFREMIHDLSASRFLAWRLFVRNISAQYRQTMLGYVWAFLPPLFTTLIWVFLNNQKVLQVGDTGMPYPVFVLSGTLLWQGFVDAFNAPLKLVDQSRTMLAKINFPREALLLAGLYEVLFNFVIRLTLLVGVFLWFKVAISPTILLVPLGIFALFALGFMLGLLLTPVGVLYQDIGKGILIIIHLWFFITPVVYPPPTSWPANLVAQFNPVSPLLVTTRQWLVGGRTTDLGGFIVVSGVTLVLLVAGWLLYRLAMPYLIERIGS